MLDTKSIGFRIGIGILLLVALHILCFDYFTDAGAGGDAGKQLADTRAQQQQALDSASRAAAGIDTAEKRITESIQAADTIAGRLDELKTKSDDCSEIIRDSAERIRICLAIVQEARAQRK